MQLKKHLGLIVAAVCVVGIIAIGFIPRPALVDIAVAKRDTLQVTIEEEGKTRVIDRYVLSAPVDGYARRLDLNVGDAVNKNQKILSLEPLRSSVLDPRSRAEAEARLAAATATLSSAERNVNAAEADAEFAASELDRLRQLYESRTISLDRFQQAEANARRTRANLESARFNAEVAQFEKKAARAALDYSAASTTDDAPETVSITAPVSGSVLKIHHESEGVVKKGEPLLEIGDPLSLEVEVDVLSRDAVQISAGTAVRFERWGGNSSLQGVVRTIEPVGFTKISALGVEEQRVLVIVDIISPKEEWQRLGDGYRMETVFVLWEGENILQIPSSALFKRQDSWAVFVINDERASLRQVELGQRSGTTAEIVSGLSEGEAVINHPGNNIEDSSRVRGR